MVIISKIKAMMGNFVLMLVAYAGILRPTLLISHAACPSSALFLGGCAVRRKWCLVLNSCRFRRDQWQGRRPGPRWWAPPPSCTLLTRDGFPLWMPEGAKQNTNVTTHSQWADTKRLNDCSFPLILHCQSYCMFVYLTLHSSFYVLKYSSRKCKSNVQIRHAFIEGDTYYLHLLICNNFQTVTLLLPFFPLLSNISVLLFLFCFVVFLLMRLHFQIQWYKYERYRSIITKCVERKGCGGFFVIYLHLSSVLVNRTVGILFKPSKCH